MALRQIRTEGDEILRKRSKEVSKITRNVKILAEDMLETMEHASGVGLAAPQVGILKRMVVINVGEGPLVLINPEIIETKGEQTNLEACLSVPGKAGEVKRPTYVKVQAQNIEGETFMVEGTELLAIALCHEIDHLDGRLFIDIAENIEEEQRS
ncbi:peptide deformylase [Vallitalea pronyensis]|uniref:Peptide deformylase n=1 Tax=Vallitalea pronyensis TaxID=1348613 RepID=A0A8J8MK52_9FIRM|nr:peptide deformylase [Vallitalea pronyensis]QUI22921.1 peptide deformylase [Vallitalea pronyensis]